MVQWLKLPAWKVGDRVFEPHSDLQVSKKHNVSSRSVNIVVSPCDQEVAPGLEFRILCLEGSVISFISPSSGGSPGPIYSICAQKWHKIPFIPGLITFAHMIKMK